MHHGLVDVKPIGVHFIQRSAATRCAASSVRAVANCVVIGIKEIAKGGMIRSKILYVLRQNEGFKEPRCMRQVPLRGTGVRHRLQVRDLRPRAAHTDAATCRASHVPLQQRSVHLQTGGAAEVLTASALRIAGSDIYALDAALALPAWLDAIQTRPGRPRRRCAKWKKATNFRGTNLLHRITNGHSK